MPATNPRLSITLAPSVAAVLRELSALTGNSQSAMVAELLEEAQPVFTRMIRILRAAEQAKKAVKEELVAGMDAAQERLEAQLGLALGEMDEFEGRLLQTAERVGRRAGRDAPTARAACGARRSPPISNRGVTPKENGKTGKGKSRAKGGHRA